MRLTLLRSPATRETDLQRQLDLTLVQLRIVQRLTAGQQLAFTDVDRRTIAEHAEPFTHILTEAGERSLRLVLNEYVDHYHQERHHQGIGQVVIEPGPEVNLSEGRLVRRKRLGGLLNYYYREAA